jgi:hypothetical protein
MLQPKNVSVSPGIGLKARQQQFHRNHKAKENQADWSQEKYQYVLEKRRGTFQVLSIYFTVNTTVHVTLPILSGPILGEHVCTAR